MASELDCEGLPYIVFHSPGEKFAEFTRPEIMKHGGYWGMLGSKVEKGGPFPGGRGGMMILNVSVRLAEAEALAAKDPAILNGFLKADIKCWNAMIDNTKPEQK